MTRKLFFWWKKTTTKRCWSSCTFPYRGSKNSPGYYHFKGVCAGGLNFCYFFLIRQAQHFYLLDHWFSGRRLSPPPVPTHHFHILCKICEHIYRQKLLLAQAGEGWGTICYKTFPNFYMFHCKKHSFCLKLSPCSIPKGKLNPLIHWLYGKPNKDHSTHKYA